MKFLVACFSCFVLDLSSDLLGSPGTDTSDPSCFADTGDGALGTSVRSPDSSSSTINDLASRQQANVSLTSQTTTSSVKSIDSNVFGSDLFGSDKVDDPFAGEDPFASPGQKDDIFGDVNASAGDDIFGSPMIVQGNSKSKEPKTTKYENLDDLFGGVSSSSGTRNMSWGSAWASGDAANSSSSAFPELGK